MDLGVLISLVVGGAVLLVLSLLFAAIPIVWYLVGSACLFKGWIGPGIGCCVLGVLIHLFQSTPGSVTWVIGRSICIRTPRSRPMSGSWPNERRIRRFASLLGPDWRGSDLSRDCLPVSRWRSGRSALSCRYRCSPGSCRHGSSSARNGSWSRHSASRSSPTSAACGDGCKPGAGEPATRGLTMGLRMVGLDRPAAKCLDPRTLQGRALRQAQ